MKKLTSPLVAAILGLVLGLGTGLYTFNRAAQVAFDRAVSLTPRKDKLINEERERGWNFWTIEIEELANELKGERERVRKQGEQIDRREAQLASERLELNKVRTELEGIRQEIASKIIEVNADESKNIRNLAKTYGDLPPKAAVAIIRDMDDVTVVKILSVMKSDGVTAIFEEMSHTPSPDGSLSKRAATLTDRLRLVKSTKTASSP
jgi:flagellar motility protein MotE (MotC chaperone)